MELGLQETGFTCDDCRWKIERGECPWDFDYDEKHPYAEDCCDFRNVRVPESEFMDNVQDILRRIIRAKLANTEDCVLFVNQSLYNVMEEAGLVVCWTEYHPGAVWTHNNICGLPVVIDPKVKLFSVLPQREARERISSII